MMHIYRKTLPLLSTLALVTACQQNPTMEASKQRAGALAELTGQEQATLEEVTVAPEPMPMAMTRIFILPVSEVGAVSDSELDEQLGELLAELGLWRHIEHIEVIGHTDSLGDEDYNLRLSLQRADRVAERLILVGLDETLVQHGGEGENQPVADNATEQGRAENRRVEVRVTGLGPWPEDGELASLPE